MAKIGERYQTADWKSEKHVPVIECPPDPSLQGENKELFV
jgi:desulfoferrodoxin (superoxide reductase-like protein)